MAENAANHRILFKHRSRKLKENSAGMIFETEPLVTCLRAGVIDPVKGHPLCPAERRVAAGTLITTNHAIIQS